jgi:DNA-binding NarL/FixJ family response regulator
VAAKSDTRAARAAHGASRARPVAAGSGALTAILGGVGTFATEALTWMLTQSGTRVIGTYPSPRALRSDLSASAAEVQVVLIDADDRAYGIAVLPDLRRSHPRLKILLLCEALTPSIARCALEQHVEGVVLKSDSVDDVILAFHHVLGGRAVMPAGWQAVPLEFACEPLDTLSMREREVLELAAGGMRNREIAERLTISTNTVKFHLRTIYTRLGVCNRVQAMHALASASADRRVAEICPAESAILDDRR